MLARIAKEQRNETKYEIGYRLPKRTQFRKSQSGKQPRHLTVDRLVRMKLPLSWQAQRRVLDIAG